MLKLVFFIAIIAPTISLSCQMEEQSKYACICSSVEGNCREKIAAIPKMTVSDVVIYETSQDSSERLRQVILKDSLSIFVEEDDSSYKFDINLERKFQKVMGFGASLTDSSFITMNSLKNNGKKEILESYYGKGGLEYSIGRVPIASNDDCLKVYSYCEKENDMELESFSIDIDRSEETGFKIDSIKQIKEIVKSRDSELKLFASPWAPPYWMTNTGKVIKNPKLKDDESIRTSYANYLKKFFDEYSKEGLDFWGMTAQNEPNGNIGYWQSLVFTPQEQRNFIRDHLGPTIKGAYPDIKIMMHDDQRYNLPKWPKVVLADPLAAQYVDGIAIHWYESLDDVVTWMWKPFDRIKQTGKMFPNKFLFASEACFGSVPTIPFLFTKGPVLGSWHRGEIYAYDIINDLNAGVISWNDWNLSLDMQGGPSWAGNYVDAPILIDTDSEDKYYRQPMFYYLAHITKFLKRDSQRVETNLADTNWISNLGFNFSPYITSFIRPDNKLCVIVLNMGYWQKKYQLRLSDGRIFNHSIPKNSIQTIIIELK
jgi:glucosylceramidase